MFDKLPRDMLIEIAKKLDRKSLSKLSETSKTIAAATKEMRGTQEKDFYKEKLQRVFHLDTPGEGATHKQEYLKRIATHKKNIKDTFIKFLANNGYPNTLINILGKKAFTQNIKRLCQENKNAFEGLATSLEEQGAHQVEKSKLYTTAAKKLKALLTTEKQAATSNRPAWR